MFDKRQCAAALATTTSTTNAVYVVLVAVWLVEVDYVADIWNVESASCNVGCNQNFNAIFFEVLQSAFALRLAFVAVNCLGRKTIFTEGFGQALYAPFGFAKYEYFFESWLAQEVLEHFDFVIFVVGVIQGFIQSVALAYIIAAGSWFLSASISAFALVYPGSA